MNRIKISLPKPLCSAVALISLAAPLALGQASSYNQAIADYNGGRYARALSEFKTLEAAYPTNVLVRYYAGLCQQSVGHIEQAKDEFRYVATYGTPQLKSMASAGLAQLQNAHMSVSSHSSSPSIAMASPSSGTAAPAAKVRKIIEFYADW
jgi:predicted Zn-dependent protease